MLLISPTFGAINAVKDIKLCISVCELSAQNYRVLLHFLYARHTENKRTTPHPLWSKKTIHRLFLYLFVFIWYFVQNWTNMAMAKGNFLAWRQRKEFKSLEEVWEHKVKLYLKITRKKKRTVMIWSYRRWQGIYESVSLSHFVWAVSREMHDVRTWILIARRIISPCLMLLVLRVKKQ